MCFPHHVPEEGMSVADDWRGVNVQPAVLSFGAHDELGNIQYEMIAEDAAFIKKYYAEEDMVFRPDLASTHYFNRSLEQKDRLKINVVLKIASNGGSTAVIGTSTSIIGGPRNSGRTY